MTVQKGSEPEAVARGVAAIVARHEAREGALLPILNDIQAELGHVPAGAIPIVAESLNLSRAEVHGVVSFYHDLKREPPDRPVVKLCRAEACQARGAERIAHLFEGDPRIAVETVFCLGLCASGPSAMVGDRVFGRIDEARARRLIEEAGR